MKKGFVEKMDSYFKNLMGDLKKGITKELSYHSIDSEEYVEIFDVLKDNLSVETLILHRCPVELHVISKLCEVLQFNRKISKLWIEHSPYDTKPTNIFNIVIDALRDNRTVEHLCMESCHLGFCRGEEKSGFFHLSEILKVNTTLKILELRNNHINTFDVDIFADALKKNSSVTILDLDCISLKDDGLHFISQALKVNRTIQTIKLGYNQISSSGAEMLADALENNQSVVSLKLKCNNLKDEGTRVLCEALKGNRFIFHLDLGLNYISPKGAKCIAELLKTNQTITSLDLQQNLIRLEGVKDLSESMKGKSSIKILNFRTNGFGVEEMEELMQMLKVNQSIRDFRMDFQVAVGGVLEERSGFLLSDMLKANKTLEKINLVSGMRLTENIDQAIIESLKQNHSLKEVYFAFSNGPFLHLQQQRKVIEMLSVNGTICKFSCFWTLREDKTNAKAFFKRNKKMHKRTKKCVVALLAMKRFREYVNVTQEKNLVTMLAMYLWNTRSDIEAWSEKYGRQKKKVKL